MRPATFLFYRKLTRMQPAGSQRVKSPSRCAHWQRLIHSDGNILAICLYLEIRQQWFANLWEWLQVASYETTCAVTVVMVIFTHVTEPLACSELGGSFAKASVSSVGWFFSWTNLMWVCLTNVISGWCWKRGALFVVFYLFN